MYGNTSLMTDTNLTFFGDQEYTGNKENKQSKKDFTKNSSNPEKDYKEYVNFLLANGCFFKTLE